MGEASDALIRETKPMPNDALSSPHEVAIQCYLSCLGQLSPTHWRRLVMNHAPWGLSLRFPTLFGSPALSSLCLLRLSQQHKKYGPLPPLLPPCPNTM